MTILSRPGIRHILSRIKHFTFRLDLQDVYKFGEALPASDNNLGQNLSAISDVLDSKESATITFKTDDSLQVLEIIDSVKLMSRYERQFALNRLKAGDKAIIGYHEGAPVFYGWMMFEEIEVTYGMFQPIETGAAFVYNLHTHPSFRRQGVVGKFYHFTADYLHNRDFHTLYCGISSDNIASIKAHEKYSFRKFGFYNTLKVLGVCFTHANCNDSPKFSVNWSI